MLEEVLNLTPNLLAKKNRLSPGNDLMKEWSVRFSQIKGIPANMGDFKNR